MSTSPPSAGAAGSLVTLARTLEERVRHCPGVAGLDAGSRLYTLGREGEVRGVRLRPVAADPARVDVALELIGLEGARLTDAGDGARRAVREWLLASDRPAEEITVRFTDLASEPVPLQTDEFSTPTSFEEDASERAPRESAEPGSPPREESSAGAAIDPRVVVVTSPPGEVVRVPVPEGAGRRTVLLITVEVVSEDAT